MLAIALGTLGKKYEEPRIAEEGLKLYVGALTETRRRLRHPTKWRADGLLLACSALGMFEVGILIFNSIYNTYGIRVSQMTDPPGGGCSFYTERNLKAMPCCHRHAAGMATPSES